MGPVLIVFFSIVGFIIFVIIDYLIAKEFYNAACLKGYNEKKYLFIPFFFGIIGYLLVIALPSRGPVQTSQTDKKEKNTDENKAGFAENEFIGVECPECGKVFSCPARSIKGKKVIVCPKCGKNINTAEYEIVEKE